MLHVIKFVLLILLLSIGGSAYASGDYIAIDATGDTVPVGEDGGYQWVAAQSFMSNAGGYLQGFGVQFEIETGTPTGGQIVYAVFGDNNGKPQNLLKEGEFAMFPTQIANDTTFSYHLLYLEPETTYWFVFSTSDQAAGNHYNMMAGNNTNYPGKYAYTIDNGHTWVSSESIDLNIYINLSSVGGAGDQVDVFGDDDSWIHENDIVALLEQALGYINSLPQNLTAPGATDYLPSETATQLFGYAKWLFSYDTAQELVGINLAPLAMTLYFALGLLIILAIAWGTIKIIILILRFVQYVVRWIIDLIPGT